jgi:sortase A
VSSAATPTSQANTAPATPVAGEPSAIGQPNRIVIPKIGLDAPVVDVGWKVIDRGDRRFTEWETADAAAGRHINSAKPGEPGNVVLSGHHNTKGEVFRAISDGKLAVGDLIYLYDDQGKRWTYTTDEVTKPLLEVGATEQQRLENARYIQPTNDARVTLVTCWPYYTNTHRVVVVAKLAQ